MSDIKLKVIEKKVNNIIQKTIRVTKTEEGQKPLVMDLSLSEAGKIVLLYNKIYHKEDIINFFEESEDYAPYILNDENLISSILERYHTLRESADGGCTENNLHWTECLTEAIKNRTNDYYNDILKYRYLNEDGSTLLGIVKAAFMKNIKITKETLFEGIDEPSLDKDTIWELYNNIMDKGKQSFYDNYAEILESEW